MFKKRIDDLYDAAAIIVGCFLTAASIVIFTVPNNIAPGGVSGLATALAHFTPISVGWWSLLLNAPLMLAGWRVMGFKALFKTGIATVMLTLLIEALTALVPGYTNNVLLASVLGGVLLGVGIGILFLRGLSSGGTDLLSVMMLRVFPNIPIGTLLMLLDTLIVAVAVFVFKDIDVAMYSIVTIFVSSKVIDSMMAGMNYAKVIYIVTDHSDEVTNVINTQTDRGVTVMPAKGGYTGEDKNVLMTITRRIALSQTLHLIKKADPKAFIFVLDATEVHGEGFKKYSPAP